MGILQLKSVCRRRRRNYVKPTPEITAENIPDREFHADHFGEKWLTGSSSLPASPPALLIMCLAFDDMLSAR